MTNTHKKIIISVLSALLLLCAVLLCVPRTVHAVTETVDKNSNCGHYSFVPGVSVKRNLYTGETLDEKARYDMALWLKLNDIDALNLRELSPVYYTWWGDRADSYYVYEFTLYRENQDGDGTSNMNAEVENKMMVVLFPWVVDGYIHMYQIVGVKNYYKDAGFVDNFSPETGNYIRAAENLYIGILENGLTWNSNGKIYSTDKNYTLVSSSLLGRSDYGINFVNDGFDGLTKILNIRTGSPYASYFVMMSHYWQTTTATGVFGSTHERSSAKAFSDSRSVAEILNNMYEQDVDFEEMFGDKAEDAETILRTNATQHIRVKYLKEIEGTPFAAPVYRDVEVPVLRKSETENGVTTIRNIITVPDVEDALGVSLKKCLDSNSYYFEYDSINDIYVLYYLENIYLRAFTVDGNYVDRFLDINLSFMDKFRPLVDGNVMPEGMYEWFFSQVLHDYPALTEYLDENNMPITYDTLYGYFGLIVIPESFSFNSIFADMFDVNASKSGEIRSFGYNNQLSYSAYQELLSEYNYGFLSRVWAELEGFVQGAEHSANFYVFYSKPGTRLQFIGEGGQEDFDDDSSVIDKGLEPAFEFMEGVFDGVQNAASGVLDVFTGITSNTKYIIYGALILGVGGVIIYLILKGKKRR